MIDGASFDIRNTVIANNIAAATGPVIWGGVYLRATAGDHLATFQYNTVYLNKALGLACVPGSSAITPVGSIFYNVSVDVAGCAAAQASSFDEPRFDPARAYHLTPSSPCVDKGGTGGPGDDLDGDVRPQGDANDCGADEYTP